MAPPRLLVVEDEPDIRETLSATLRLAGFRVTTAADGLQALAYARRERPDVVLLDLAPAGSALDVQPGGAAMHGRDVVRRLRAGGVRAPVLYLTARDGVEDEAAGLRRGGDDYLTKPFRPQDVVARIEALLSRAGGPRPAGARPGRLRFADIELDEQSHDVYKAGVPVALSATEFKLLRYFLANPARVLSKRQILNHVWEYGPGPNTNVVESYVSYLRKKIDTSVPRLIHTVRGVGYVLKLPPA
ncbi:MAG: response regulator transcription factor [Micromonosporaceae bacterium]|nr:response regulator transcription factor [Micromonosporaceae bacterium]